MTVVSNDPSFWPLISFIIENNYVIVACLTVLVYDWALTFGQEVELLWRQRWSLMTVLYFSVRYAGIPFTILAILQSSPSVSLTDAGCTIQFFVTEWTSITVSIMLGVIIIIRLYAMYQRSRKMLVFLVVIFLAIQIATVAINAIQSNLISGEEFIFSGTHQCGNNLQGDAGFLTQMSWILGTVWEVLALCLAIWIVIKHFRELRRSSAEWAFGDCFAVLIKTHVLYFLSYAAVSCFELGYLSPNIANSTSVGAEIYDGILQIVQIVQMFVLGPRLILSLRKYNAKLVTNSDEGTAMTSIAFQDRVQISTGSGV